MPLRIKLSLSTHQSITAQLRQASPPVQEEETADGEPVRDLREELGHQAHHGQVTPACLGQFPLPTRGGYWCAIAMERRPAAEANNLLVYIQYLEYLGLNKLLGNSGFISIRAEDIRLNDVDLTSQILDLVPDGLRSFHNDI